MCLRCSLELAEKGLLQDIISRQITFLGHVIRKDGLEKSANIHITIGIGSQIISVHVIKENKEKHS